MIQIAIKRPRKPRVFRPFLSDSGPCQHNEICDSCMAAYDEQVSNERPGHVWAVDEGKVIYLEDVVFEAHLGRKLKPTESIVHKNGNLKDNRLENLEVIEIPEMGK